MEELYDLFGDNTEKDAKMSWEQFRKFSLKAPMVVDWLTDLGQSLAETFRKMNKAMNFESDVAPIAPPGAVARARALRTTTRKAKTPIRCSRQLRLR